MKDNNNNKQTKQIEKNKPKKNNNNNNCNHIKSIKHRTTNETNRLISCIMRNGCRQPLVLLHRVTFVSPIAGFRFSAQANCVDLSPLDLFQIPAPFHCSSQSTLYNHFHPWVHWLVNCLVPQRYFSSLPRKNTRWPRCRGLDPVEMIDV